MTNTYDILLNPPPLHPKAPEKMMDAGLLATQQIGKEEKQQASQPATQQPSQAANPQTSRVENQQASKSENQPTSKPLKKFASYLAEDLFYEFKTLAIQLRKKDYEVLQEAVEEYLKKKKGG